MIRKNQPPRGASSFFKIGDIDRFLATLARFSFSMGAFLFREGTQNTFTVCVCVYPSRVVIRQSTRGWVVQKGRSKGRVAPANNRFDFQWRAHLESYRTTHRECATPFVCPFVRSFVCVCVRRRRRRCGVSSPRELRIARRGPRVPPVLRRRRQSPAFEPRRERIVVDHHW